MAYKINSVTLKVRTKN